MLHRAYVLQAEFAVEKTRLKCILKSKGAADDARGLHLHLHRSSWNFQRPREAPGSPRKPPGGPRSFQEASGRPREASRSLQEANEGPKRVQNGPVRVSQKIGFLARSQELAESIGFSNRMAQKPN